LGNGFDEKLDSIRTLKWLPYIGKNHKNLTTGKKLLIIGESHYLPNKAEDWYEDVKKRLFTREIFIMNQINQSIDDMGKVLRNIQKILLNDDLSDDQKNKLWNSVSYYNFIQKVLDSSKDRPIEGDYIIGWDTFFKVIEVLNPDYCLFCGVSAINNTGAMINAAEKNSFSQRIDDKKNLLVMMYKQKNYQLVNMVKKF
jgi:hypothetical protein